MIGIPVNIGVEDELSEAVLRRLLGFTGRGYSIGTANRRGGFGYLKRTVQGWNRAAASLPFVLLTDLDSAPCASALIRSWIPDPVHPNLVIRVAVREVESWLLADSNGLAKYLRVNSRIFPENPDHLFDPKAKLVQIARTSNSYDVRSSLVPKRNSTATQGPDYNYFLRGFVEHRWDILAALERSPSLNRALQKFQTFTPTWI